jgi:putative ABC transport system permease protein
LVFSVLGTLRGVRAIQRLKPAEAMRPKPPLTGRSVVLERCRWFWRLLRFETQMVLRGLFRTRVRTLVGIFAAAMGAAIMVTAFAIFLLNVVIDVLYAVLDPRIRY